MIWPFGDIAPMSYDVITADNPWPFSLYSELGDEKSASAYYETMSIEDLKALPVSYLARGDCLLLMFVAAPTLPQAIEVMGAWGFTYKTELVWRKTTRRGKVRMGPGYRARTMHESVLLGTIGNPQHKPFPSLFDGLAREHSRKPDTFYEMVVKHTPHAFRIDLFGRQGRPGFDVWGDESTKFDDPSVKSTKRERRAPVPLPEPMALFPAA